MNTCDHTSHKPSAVSSRVLTAVFKGVWMAGALVIAASMWLIISAFGTDSAAGQSWQPAGELGAIGLCLGAMLVVLGLLTHSAAAQAEHREGPDRLPARS
ncbi:MULTISPECIES: hypothetical protein [unclassified Streptomyces]|uniref:hypothetical protein n=1 Tax=unclassified Streptomyces TaxID=2593676 RepID=UPI003798DE4E